MNIFNSFENLGFNALVTDEFGLTLQTIWPYAVVMERSNKIFDEWIIFGLSIRQARQKIKNENINIGMLSSDMADVVLFSREKNEKNTKNNG